MAVFSSLASFFKRHKRKILITASVSVSVYYLVNEFVIKKFRNFQNSLKQELIFKQQIKQRFIQTQQDCYYTILALLPVMTTPIVEYLPVELITQALRMKKSNQDSSSHVNGTNNLTEDNLNLLDNDPKISSYLEKSKIELWNMLKIKTITRTLTLIYSLSGLLLITRLQLNILARRSYLEAAIEMAGVTNVNQNIDSEENYMIEQSYLSLSWWLLNKGWFNMANIIEPLVINRFGSVKPKTELTVQDFEDSLLDIVSQISPNQLLAGLFPKDYEDLVETLLNTNPGLIETLDDHSSNLMKLINETNSIIYENSYVESLLHSLVETAVSTLSFSLSNSLNETSNSLLASSTEASAGVLPPFSDNSQNKFKLATFLAQLSVQNNILIDNNNIMPQTEIDEEDIEGFINSLTNKDINESHLTGNIYVNNINQLDELDEFSAGIYSNFE
jgi:peroxin-3